MTLALIISVWWHIPYMHSMPVSPFEPESFVPWPSSVNQVAPPPLFCQPGMCPA